MLLAGKSIVEKDAKVFKRKILLLMRNVDTFAVI